MPDTSSTIGGFSILPVSIPPLPSFPQTVVHHIYARRNAPKIATPNDSRSLFVTNLPVDSTQLHLRGLVTTLVGAGRFESIEFDADAKPALPSDTDPGQLARLAAHAKKRKREDDEDKRAKEDDAARFPETWSRPLRKSGSSAVILLADDKSVELVLKAISKLHKSKKYPTWGAGVSERVPPLGPQWLQEHNRLSYPAREVVEEAVDAFFTAFNRRELEAAELAKRLRNEPDEDGFVTVTRGAGRQAPARRDEAEEARRKMLEREERKKKELTNFYRFQLRERKKAEQADLIRRFDEDRKKVAAMREKRAKFRPET